MKINFTFLLRRRVKNVSFFLMLFMCTTSSFTMSNQDSLVLEQLNSRMQNLEEQNQNMIDNLDNKSTEIDLKIDGYHQEKTFLDRFIGVAGGISLAFFIGLLLGARAIVRRRLDKEFDNAFNDRKGQVLQLLQAYDKESELKKSKCIYVIASKNADTDALEKFLVELKFNATRPKKVDTYEAIPHHEKYDVLLLFRELGNGPLDDDIVMEYARNSRPDSIVFLFGQGPIELGDVKRRSSSATFWSQLYGNLISAMKYQQLID
jgi:hypothetical protein